MQERDGCDAVAAWFLISVLPSRQTWRRHWRRANVAAVHWCLSVRQQEVKDRISPFCVRAKILKKLSRTMWLNQVPIGPLLWFASCLALQSWLSFAWITLASQGNVIAIWLLLHFCPIFDSTTNPTGNLHQHGCFLSNFQFSSHQQQWSRRWFGHYLGTTWTGRQSSGTTSNKQQ